jgi:hypothetical protein
MFPKFSKMRRNCVGDGGEQPPSNVPTVSYEDEQQKSEGLPHPGRHRWSLDVSTYISLV